MPVTFVTCFVDIYKNTYENRTIDWRFERFEEMARTGINLCVYTSPDFFKYIDVEKFPNVRLYDAGVATATSSQPRTPPAADNSTEELDIVSSSIPTEAGVLQGAAAPVAAPVVWIEEQSVGCGLPSVRNEAKDTAEYLAIMNSKALFVADAAEKNPFGTTHFAWVDFSLSYVLFDKERSLRYLADLGQRTFVPKMFAIPGCWDHKYDNVDVDHITERICWRFCGGFFIGDTESILKFGDLYKTKYPEFIALHRKLVWEVNFWAWLEVNSDWAPEWYPGGHDDTIVTNLSASYFSLNLHDLGSTYTKHRYPEIPGYNPSSASYIKHNGKHLLNTRYVNYWNSATGAYLFYDGTTVLRTKNILSVLDDNMEPQSYEEMDESTIELPRHETYSRGIEDVRLYEDTDTRQLKYIATTVEYHGTGGNRMVIGNYDYETKTYSESRIIQPPTDTWCEKNWVPVPTSRQSQKQKFVYKWAPMEIGEIIDDDNNQLRIVDRHEDTANIPLFSKMKGSAPFIEISECELVGVIHFSEETKPRHYFHMLVVLDRETFKPLRYSESFVFENIGIEFCIGFDVSVENKYLFWISQFDREPALITIDMDRIKCKYIV